MKNWFIETMVLYNFIDIETNNIAEDIETFTFIIQSKSEYNARNEAVKDSIERLTNMVGDVSAISVFINDCYKTSDDARIE